MKFTGNMQLGPRKTPVDFTDRTSNDDPAVAIFAISFQYLLDIAALKCFTLLVVVIQILHSFIWYIVFG